MKFIPIARPIVNNREAKNVSSTIKSGWITMGKKVKELENKISKYIGVKHAILFNNGTSSLHAALIALGVKKGDEVIVPTLSYISSANVIEYCGAKPVFCEISPETFNVTYETIRKKITKRTKAIITVDLKGMPIDYDQIRKLKKKFKIPILSDSAEAFGAMYKENKVGSQMDVHSFSFFANKNITMGEGGLVTTNNNKIAKICQIIRNQGQKSRYNHIMLGNNYRPTDYAASMGLSQLKRVDYILKEKSKIASIYHKEFSKNKYIEAPFVPSYVGKHSWYMYCIKFKKPINRKKIQNHLHKKNIETRLSFPPIHLQKYYKDKYNYKKKMFGISESTFDAFLDIPIFPGITKKQMNYVVKNILDAVNLQLK